MSGLNDEGPQERFEEFLRTYKDEVGKLVYWSRLQQMSINDESSIVVNFQDLASFDSVFITLATEDPAQFLKIINGALVSVLKIEDPEYVSAIDTNLLKVRIIDYPEHIPLRAIRSKHIGRLLHISGIMMRASIVKPLLVEAMFRCRICGGDIPQTQEDGRYTEPALCPVCGKKTAMRLIPELSHFIDWQKVRIQESPEELPPGQMPRSVDVIFEGDIVDISRPGDFVKVTGLLETTPDFSRR
ncbi:MAG: minichromosome maintenance protein MCM, partial [Candidatus Thorarchaeota archaeon]|nr:minichromosome maintenance protein MCM [Candidatus Thorarchaeota archaeon]